MDIQKHRRLVAYLAVKGHEVVLAQAVDFNVLDHDHFIVSFGEEGVVYWR